ncbi:hypothetical protein DENSPDRAFT_835230, partial [Dentipellis sp. KUC8613]
MASLCEDVSALARCPDIYASLTTEDLGRFVRYARYIKCEVMLNMNGHVGEPPIALPLYVFEFLRDVLGFDDAITSHCWSVLKDHVWASDGLPELSGAEAARFHAVGHKGERSSEWISSDMFYPPVLQCMHCDTLLKNMSRFAVVLFTRVGARPGYTTSLLCPHCKIRYHPNYYIQDCVRCYYRGIPDAFQLEEHAFITVDLCKFFTALMVVAHVSGQGCAQVYNMTMADTKHVRPRDWPQSFTLRTDEVWRSFFWNALLRDHSEHGTLLTVPDEGNQESRLEFAMVRRNLQMVEEGQPARMHACDVCEKFVEGTGYKGLRSLRAVVTDGITIGHPCCAVHNCTRPLINNRHHYCSVHKSDVLKCAITACEARAERGYRTCSKPDHRRVEEIRNERGKAFFQLQQRLKKAFPGPSYLFDANSDPDVLVDYSEDNDNNEDLPHGAKSDKGNRKLQSRFGRRCTHNEQLVVCCCGVVAARATMYGAEAISGVKDFLKSVYGHNPDNLPDVIFFDNNCRLQEHLFRQKDTFFRRVILAVDVFHFKSKHKEADAFCQKHCNPALWPELNDGKGNWVFNSSAAEQANVWMGGYLSIVREMLAYRYDFFMDEIIKRRNEQLISKLRDDGKMPYIVPL